MSVEISRKQFLRGRFREPSHLNLEPGGLELESDEAVTVGIEINSLCLSLSGTTCRLCEDECNRQAISFKLLTGGRAVPLVSEADCNGCLDCAPLCPVDAIHPICAPVQADTGENLQETSA